MPEEPRFAERLSLGPVVVDVGYDFIGMPTARTIGHVLEAADLGGEISVTLHQYTGDPDDLYEGDPPEGSIEMWKLLLAEMKDMLARCFIFCRMRVAGAELLGARLEADDEKNLDAAIEELGKEFMLVKPEHALQAIEKRHRGEQATAGWLAHLATFMEAQQEDPGEDITFGEAVDRHEKGTEDLRRLVEGEAGEDE